jgi:hypothetical protein
MLYFFLSPDDSEPPVVQSAEGFLNFSSISRDHMGWYKCAADYGTNNFASSGYYLNVRGECRQLIFVGQPTHTHAAPNSNWQHAVCERRLVCQEKHTHAKSCIFTLYTFRTRCIIVLVKFSLTETMFRFL